MFEIIGLIFATALLFLLSALVSCFFALVAWLILRARKGSKRRWIILGGLIPPASAAYVLFAAVFFDFFIPGATDRLFGDFNERLPNGYVLSGLGKMPDFSYIDSKNNGRAQPQLLGGVSRIRVDGPIVIGQYSHRSGSFDEPVPGDIKFFIFNTQTSELKNLKELPSNGEFSGHPVQLVKSELFHSHEPPEILRRRIEDIIYFGPPALAALSYLTLLLLLRWKKHPPNAFA